VTPEGKVKVLDFGLAKAFQEEHPPTLSNSPTLIGASTPGVILGTAGLARHYLWKPVHHV
jgi:hypothetical protein